LGRERAEPAPGRARPGAGVNNPEERREEELPDEERAPDSEVERPEEENAPEERPSDYPVGPPLTP
jgi:hypothetical protein